MIYGMSFSTLEAVSAHVAHARRKHPWPAGMSWGKKLRVLLSEVWELVWAVVWERDSWRIREEALDCIAVLVRIVEGE